MKSKGIQERDRQIVADYLNPDGDPTLASLATKYGLSRERIRQILEAAGGKGRRRPATLEEVEAKLVDLGPEKVELLQSRCHTLKQLARVLGTSVPTINTLGLTPRARATFDWWVHYGPDEDEKVTYDRVEMRELKEMLSEWAGQHQGRFTLTEFTQWANETGRDKRSEQRHRMTLRRNGLTAFEAFKVLGIDTSSVQDQIPLNRLPRKTAEETVDRFVVDYWKQNLAPSVAGYRTWRAGQTPRPMSVTTLYNAFEGRTWKWIIEQSMQRSGIEKEDDR